MPKRTATSSSLAGITPSELNQVFDEATRRAVALVRREHPNVIGVMVHGSVARGEPGPFSDIDLVAVTGRGRKPSEFSYYEGENYVGVEFLQVRDLAREISDRKQIFWPVGSEMTTQAR